MAVNDYVLRVKPTAGQTAPRDEVSGVSFTGTGTPTLIDEGSEKAWAVTFGTLLKKTGLNMALNGAIDGGGKTLAIRFKMVTTSSDSFMPMAGVAKSGALLAEAFFAGQNGGNSYRGRVNPSGTTIGSTSIASKPNGVIYTIVYKFATLVAGSSDEGKLWVNTTGRVGTAPDAVSGGTTAFTATFTDAYINCQGTAGAYNLLDFVLWDGEKTDAECAQLADSLRTTLDAGGTTTPITFTGTIPNQTFTASQSVSVDLSTYFTGTQTPFTFAASGTSLAGTGLSITSAGLLTGTATEGSVVGVTITGTDADLATAVSNTFNVTVNASGTPVAFGGTISAISGTQNAAITSVDTSTFFTGSLTPFTYSLFSGALPTGVTLNSSTGVISGTPTVSFSGNIVVRATDTGTNTADSNTIAVTIAAVATGTITSQPLTRNNGTASGVVSLSHIDVSLQSTGALVVRKTGVSTNGSSVFTFSDAAITTGSTYIVSWLESGGESGIAYNVVAS